ncbi:signal peptidase I [Lacinutrix sp. 5H-3-7-4]|uniref:signal peptidase I n=1 Tax=Lacinutrix sp. (strain 5H-3-7-4) TaxID=983544 RepID=UPI00020A3570|nr:signal peptidase I [Lacinutrix sp. 5H-3-7-4]AEH01721.1 signal peptidase I [Lacinutrix sp. 5H-3-7-4]
MNGTQWIIFFFVIQVIHGLATWKLYIKAGRQAWEAFVPVYNAVILMKIIRRPWWWTILLFLPIVNLIMFPVVWVETARSFGKNSNLDTFLAIITLGFYNFYLNYAAKDVIYIEDRSLMPRTGAGDWVSSILFAVVAATIVHTYFIQPFVIPSSSLEKSLLVGDFLFVSKFHYGARVPMTTVALPMVHDSIPLTKQKSYLFSDKYENRKTSLLNKLQLPYLRIPGFEKIERNEIVVFNQPADTLLDMNDFTPDRNYYKPIDKKTNLVKRCVGIAGDSLELRDGVVYINGKRNVLPERAKLQFFYNIKTTMPINNFRSKYGITEDRGYETYSISNEYWDNPDVKQALEQNVNVDLTVVSRDSLNTQVAGALTQTVFDRLNMSIAEKKYMANMTEELAAQVAKDPAIELVEKDISKSSSTRLFPHDSEYRFSSDNFGPIYIPQAGKTIKLDINVLPLYKRVISEYEDNKVTTRGNQILINDEVATSYTFKQDYYWMMGDNRQNSIDSRYWGFVPFDHVVGKPVMVWMSWDSNASGINKIRWNRLFTTVHGDGKPVSLLIPVLILIGGLIGYNKFKKRKQKA